jgi:DNA-binding MarR family transcriptional regulator
MADPELTHILLAWSAAFMRRSMHDFLRFARREVLSMVQMNVLLRIYYHGACDISALIDILQVTKAAAGQLVERMEQQGLVLREPDPRDRRAWRVSLSEKGRALVEAGVAARQAWMNDLFEHIPPHERPAVIHALQILTTAAETMETAGKGRES